MSANKERGGVGGEVVRQAESALGSTCPCFPACPPWTPQTPPCTPAAAGIGGAALVRLPARARHQLAEYRKHLRTGGEGR